MVVGALPFHAAAIALGATVAVSAAWLLHQSTDAARPYADALTTVFSLIATYLEVTKTLEAWLYWLAVNLLSIWLYHDRQLDIYAALIGVYAALSAWGLWSWWRLSRNRAVSRSLRTLAPRCACATRSEPDASEGTVSARDACPDDPGNRSGCVASWMRGHLTFGARTRGALLAVQSADSGERDGCQLEH